MLHRRLLSSTARRLASTLENPQLTPFRVFDRHVKRLQKDRAAGFDGGERSRTVDYVRNEIADRMAERLAVRILNAQHPPSNPRSRILSATCLPYWT